MSTSFAGETKKMPVSQCAVTNRQRAVLTKQVKAGQQTVLATEPRMRDGGKRFVIISGSPTRESQPTRNTVRRVFAAKLSLLHGSFQVWFHYSLLRLILTESHSAYRRILSERCKRMALNYAEVQESLPQIACSGSRNERQFCSASIRTLSAERPYLTLGDLRLFVAGFLQAERWYAHLGTQRRNEQLDSWASDSIPAAPTEQYASSR